MSTFDVYTKSNCTNCVLAKNLLNAHGANYREIPIGTAILVEELMTRYPAARAAPVIVLDGMYVGGYKELQQLLEASPVLLNE